MNGGDIEGVGVTFELVDKAFDAFFLFKEASALFRAKFYIIRGIEHKQNARSGKETHAIRVSESSQLIHALLVDSNPLPLHREVTYPTISREQIETKESFYRSGSGSLLQWTCTRCLMMACSAECTRCMITRKQRKRPHLLRFQQSGI